MIELAPNSKRGLELKGPLILVGGYGREIDPTIIAHANALVTLPTSLRPRAPAWRQPRVQELPGGFLLNRGGANPGLAAVLREQRHLWPRLTIPVILSLAVQDVSRWIGIGVRRARSGVVSALECELEEELASAPAIPALKSGTDLPLLAKIPIERVVEAAELAITVGADALTVGLTPRGHALVRGEIWEGRLAGTIVKPLVLRAVRAVTEQFPDVPVIAAGGVQTADDVRDLLSAGARAVQVDVALWRDPSVFIEIASALGT